MENLGSPQAPVTLHACLEALTHLDERSMLTSAGDEWSARELLSWLGTFHPHFLQVPVYVEPPDANGDGAIYEVAQRGPHLPDVPLYRIMRRPGTLPPEEGRASTPDHLAGPERGGLTS